MRMPGGAPAHTVDRPVELFDIMATILELAEVKAEHTHFARSLAPQLSGAPADEERAAFAEAGYDPHEPHCFEGRSVGEYARRGPQDIYYQKGLLQQTHPESVCRTIMVRTPTHKFIYRTSDICELYDMKADPQELENLYGRPEVAEVQRQLERRLLDFYLHTSDVTPWDEDRRGLPEGGFKAAGL
jgi:choline-sulfatase